MISLEQLNEEIAALESEKPSYQVMERLADMYVVRDHMLVGRNADHAPSVAKTLPCLNTGTEFAHAVDGKSAEAVMDLFDELMTTLSAINPRLYECVMKKL